MNVRHGLACVFARVKDDSESRFVYPLLGSEVRSHSEDVTHKLLVMFLEMEHSRDMVFWDYQDVDRCFGIYVLERQYLVVLIDDVSGDLFPDDSAENSVRFGFFHGYVLSRRNLHSIFEGNIAQTGNTRNFFLKSVLAARPVQCQVLHKVLGTR